MGLPLWMPKGSDVRQNLITFLTKELRKRGYKIVTTPHIGNVNLYKTSGHFEKYGADSFQPISTPTGRRAVYAETNELSSSL